MCPKNKNNKLKEAKKYCTAADFGSNLLRANVYIFQKMTIFYRDHLGKYPYLSREGRRVNGGIPQLGDLSAHLSLAITQMSSLLQPNFAGLAVIDWEEWQPLWERNFGAKMEYRRLSKLLVRQERPDLSDRAMTSLARQKFEESSRKYMEETLWSAVRGRPNGLWGFYGFPVCFNKHKRKTGRTNDNHVLSTSVTYIYIISFKIDIYTGHSNTVVMR